MLQRHEVQIGEERPARRSPIGREEAQRWLAELETVLVVRGRSVQRIPAAEVTLEDLTGPTGNFRAPMVRRGETLLVGFHEGALQELLESGP